MGHRARFRRRARCYFRFSTTAVKRQIQNMNPEHVYPQSLLLHGQGLECTRSCRTTLCVYYLRF